MKLKITWLESILSRWGPDAPGDPESVNPNKLDLPNDKRREMSDASMPDIYAVTVPDLKILGPSVPGADKEGGFNLGNWVSERRQIQRYI